MNAKVDTSNIKQYTKSLDPNTGKAIPNGYWLNNRGVLIPSSKVQDLDKRREECIAKIASSAKSLQELVKETKEEMFGYFYDFIALSANEYDTKIGGEKGNTTLPNFDNSYKITMTINENIVFDERLIVAKGLVDECLNEWSKNANDTIKAIINQAFQVDKEGNISTYRVLGLRSIKVEVTDSCYEKWQQALKAIQDSIHIASTKKYMRIYEKDEEDKLKQITLDFSSM